MLGFELHLLGGRVMDVVLTAVVAGAVAAIQPTVTRSVKDGYAALRTVLIDLYAGFRGSLASLETNPQDENAAKAVLEHIALSGAASSPAVLELAEQVRTLVAAEFSGLIGVVEVKVDRLKAGGDIRVEGGDVFVDGSDWEAGGDAFFSGSKKKLQ